MEGHTADDTPLIFWLLAGYFRLSGPHMKTEGIFRVTGSDAKIRELELHMSQGDYPFLTRVAEPHTVTNYWKRVLREMREPLIPYKLYHSFEQIAQIAIDTSPNAQIDQIMLLNLKFLLNQLPPLNFNTLKFHAEFFKEVSDMQPFNKMNIYNLAVTVGPNIFRP